MSVSQVLSSYENRWIEPRTKHPRIQLKSYFLGVLEFVFESKNRLRDCIYWCCSNLPTLERKRSSPFSNGTLLMIGYKSCRTGSWIGRHLRELRLIVRVFSGSHLVKSAFFTYPYSQTERTGICFASWLYRSELTFCAVRCFWTTMSTYIQSY